MKEFENELTFLGLDTKKQIKAIDSNTNKPSKSNEDIKDTERFFLYDILYNSKNLFKNPKMNFSKNDNPSDLVYNSLDNEGKQIVKNIKKNISKFYYDPNLIIPSLNSIASKNVLLHKFDDMLNFKSNINYSRINKMMIKYCKKLNNEDIYSSIVHKPYANKLLSEEQIYTNNKDHIEVVNNRKMPLYNELVAKSILLNDKGSILQRLHIEKLYDCKVNMNIKDLRKCFEQSLDYTKGKFVHETLSFQNINYLFGLLNKGRKSLEKKGILDLLSSLHKNLEIMNRQYFNYVNKLSFNNSLFSTPDQLPLNENGTTIEFLSLIQRMSICNLKLNYCFSDPNCVFKSFKREFNSKKKRRSSPCLPIKLVEPAIINQIKLEDNPFCLLPLVTPTLRVEKAEESQMEKKSDDDTKDNSKSFNKIIYKDTHQDKFSESIVKILNDTEETQKEKNPERSMHSGPREVGKTLSVEMTKDSKDIKDMEDSIIENEVLYDNKNIKMENKPDSIKSIEDSKNHLSEKAIDVKRDPKRIGMDVLEGLRNPSVHAQWNQENSGINNKREDTQAHNMNNLNQYDNLATYYKENNFYNSTIFGNANKENSLYAFTNGKVPETKSIQSLFNSLENRAKNNVFNDKDLKLRKKKKSFASTAPISEVLSGLNDFNNNELLLLGKKRKKELFEFEDTLIRSLNEHRQPIFVAEEKEDKRTPSEKAKVNANAFDLKKLNAVSLKIEPKPEKNTDYGINNNILNVNVEKLDFIKPTLEPETRKDSYYKPDLDKKPSFFDYNHSNNILNEKVKSMLNLSENFINNKLSSDSLEQKAEDDDFWVFNHHD